MSITIETLGLDKLSQYLLRVERNADIAASQAINKTADSGRTLASREIRDQVNFKANYLNDPAKRRLAVTQKASATNLEATVTGRDRPTSLARFAVGSRTVSTKRRAIRVKVSGKGSSKQIKNAFFMKLRKGSAAVTEENNNEGLAVRLRPGEPISNKRSMVPVGNSGLYLLYGPSVGQVARDVFADIAPDVGSRLQDEFTRNLKRLTGGR